VDSRYNLALESGPDMGASGDGQGLYLPAYRRYDGRFYAHAGEDALETAILNDRHTLIVSGLYGLIRLEEPIQAYNCHLDDEIVSDQAGPGCFRIADLWRENDLMTTALKEYIQQASRDGRRPVRYVLDLLSEGSYQRIFNWDHLHTWFAEQGIEWGHRVVHGVREPGFLADLGRLFQHEVSGNVLLSEPGKVEHECLRTINEQKGALLLSRDVRLDAFTDTLLLNVLGEKTWKGLTQVARDELIQGELFFQLYDARSSKQDSERAPRIINFFSALEMELYQLCGKQGSQETLGSSVHHLCKGALKHLFPIAWQRDETCRQLTTLLAIRNRMSHRGTVLRRDLVAARDLIIQPGGILTRLFSLRRT